MSQIIQALQNGTDAAKGTVLRQTIERIELKPFQEWSQVETDVWQLHHFETLDQTAKDDLKKRLLKMSLLSNGITNTKTAKDAGLGDNVSNWILHLTPSDLSGVNLCPSATPGCRAACLNGAGRGLFDGVQVPRLRKTLYFLKLRKQFLSHLDKELSKISAKAASHIIVRLNGTSDLAWETMPIRDGKNFFELYQNVTFYDYTAVIRRVERLKMKPLANYHLTFSAKESNWDDCLKALALGTNVATVFRTASLPETYQGYTVLDGDTHDFRFLDLRHESKGYIVGLKAKGVAKRDTTGFVRDVSQNKKVA